MVGKRGGGTGGGRAAKQKVRTAKRRSASSTRWLQRQLNDPYVQEAQRVGYRSRAAFKLIDIDRKYGLLRRGMRIVDLGAAPGGWTQVAAERTGPEGRIVAIDLLEIEPIAGVETLVGDFHETATREAVRAALGGPVDLVMSDMGAAATGHASTDHLRSAALAEAAFEFAVEVLAPGGALLVKLLQGAEERAFVQRLRGRFAKVERVKPPASRDRSAEMYIVGQGFRGPAAS